MQDDFKLVTPQPRRKYDNPTETERNVSLWLGGTVALVGLVYIIGGESKFLNPSLVAAETVAPYWVWGIIFVLIGLFILCSFKYMIHWVSLLAGAFFYAFFATLYVIAAFTEPKASWVAAVYAVAFGVGLLASSVRRRKLSIEREMQDLTPYE